MFQLCADEAQSSRLQFATLGAAHKDEKPKCGLATKLHLSDRKACTHDQTISGLHNQLYSL
jgi:hypothetical protein